MKENKCTECGKRVLNMTKCHSCWKKAQGLRSFQVWVSEYELESLNTKAKKYSSKREMLQMFLKEGVQ